MSTTRWDASCGIIERHIRIADDVATLVASEDQGRIDETTLTLSLRERPRDI